MTEDMLFLDLKWKSYLKGADFTTLNEVVLVPPVSIHAPGISRADVCVLLLVTGPVEFPRDH